MEELAGWTILAVASIPFAVAGIALFFCGAAYVNRAAEECFEVHDSSHDKSSQNLAYIRCHPRTMRGFWLVLAGGIFLLPAAILLDLYKGTWFYVYAGGIIISIAAIALLKEKSYAESLKKELGIE